MFRDIRYGRLATLRLAAGLCLLLGAAKIEAEEIGVAYQELAPYVFTEDGHAAGPGIELFRAMTSGTAIDAKDPKLTPIKRILFSLQHEKAIVVAMDRTPEREKLGLTWVAEVCRGWLTFATLRNHPPINSFDEARSLPRIGANSGGGPAEILLSKGVTSIAEFNTTVGLPGMAAMLKAGRVDAWFGIRIFIEGTWQRLGNPLDQLEFGGPIEPVGVWIAASPSVDADIIDILRNRFAALKKEGKLAAFSVCGSAD